MNTFVALFHPLFFPGTLSSSCTVSLVPRVGLAFSCPSSFIHYVPFVNFIFPSEPFSNLYLSFQSPLEAHFSSVAEAVWSKFTLPFIPRWAISTRPSHQWKVMNGWAFRIVPCLPTEPMETKQASTKRQHPRKDRTTRWKEHVSLNDHVALSWLPT